MSDQEVPIGILLDGFDLRAILDRVPDKKGSEPTPPDPIDNRTHLVLVQRLSDLPDPQFEQVLFGFKPPAGLISSEAQGKRAVDLLTWLEGPTGKGYPALLEVLTDLGIPRP